MRNVAGVVTKEGEDWSDRFNREAPRYGIPPRLGVALGIMESNLERYSRRPWNPAEDYAYWPDVSGGPFHQAIAWAPIGDQRTGPDWRNSVRCYRENIDAVMTELQENIDLAFEIAFTHLAA
jgi:hypothetical protein